MEVCAESQCLTSVRWSSDELSRDSIVSVRHEEKSKLSGSPCRVFMSFGVKILFFTVATKNFGSSGKWSDKFSIEQKKTAEHFVHLNNHKQIYNNEQQFSISCMGALQP